MDRYGHDALMKLAQEIVSNWCGERGSLVYLGDSTNYVFRFLARGQPHYLRITPQGHRSYTQLQAELDFILYLHDHGVSVSVPVASINNNYIEPAEGLHSIVFTGVEGERFTFREPALDERNFYLRGRLFGQIHRLSRDYHPPTHCRRPAWHEDELLSGVSSYLPASEEIVWQEYDAVMDWLAGLPRDAQLFGLIHGDLGSSNFLCNGESFNIFDFDDCCYHWYLYDLAVTFYPHGARNGALKLLTALLAGYELHADAEIVNLITGLCRFRQLYLFLHYAHKWGLTGISARQADWFANKRTNITRGYMINVKIPDFLE